MKKNTLLLSNIQMLRAAAAIAVVLHHAYPHYQAMGGDIQWIIIISQWGFMGVDIFFVISGFIMAYTTFGKARTVGNAKTFFKHRLFRIYLGYWPFFLLMLLAIFVTNPQKIESLDIFGSFFLTNADMFQLVLPVSWSLSYELYFYLLFLFTFIFSVRQLYRVIPIFMVMILFLVLFTFYDPSLPQSFFYSPFLLEFFAGVILYMYREYLIKLWLLPMALILLLVSYSYGIHDELKNGLYRVLSFGTGAFFIVLSALILEHYQLFCAGKRLEALGNASYTLYLSHLLIIQTFYFSGLRGVFTADNQWLPLLGLLSILLLSVLFSLAYYRKIERPVYQKAIQYGQK